MPNRQAWTAWRKFVYTFTNGSLKLAVPLGKWKELPPKQFTQLYNHETKMLMIREHNQWRAHKRSKVRRRTWEFLTVTSDTLSAIPTTAVPIDILRRTHDVIITNIPSTYAQHDNTDPDIKDATTRHISRNFSIWKHLHNHVEWELPESKARQLLMSTTKLNIASDGGYDPKTGISTYGWVIATGDQVLVTGRGPAEAHPTMANSFRAEGYGAASALVFLTAFYQANQVETNTKTWHMYIDNKSMVSRLTEHETPWKRKA
jgi:hypothetical protein